MDGGDTKPSAAPAAPEAAAAQATPAKPKTAAGPTTKEALLAAMLVQNQRQSEAQLKTAKKGQAEVAQIEKTKKRTLVFIAIVIGIIVFWILKAMYDVRAKYKWYIETMEKWHAVDAAVTGGVNDFGDPFKIAWATEYPNFTTTLFSKTANIQYPTAVIRSLTIQETYDRMAEQDNPAYYLNLMFIAASLDAQKPVDAIICEAISSLNPEYCWADCAPGEKYGADQIVADIGGTAMSLGMTVGMINPIAGIAAACVGAVLGGIKAGVAAENAKKACSMNGVNCKKTPQSAC